MINACEGRAFPETPTTGSCCWGTVITNDPAHCTCWKPVYDLEQQPPQPELETPMRGTMCADCAYRPGSPERSGDPAAITNKEGLDALVHSGSTFWCHQGIRRPAHWVHPSGATTPGSPLNYCPPIEDGRPFKADGTPADICAGWAARRVKHMWQQSQAAR